MDEKKSELKVEKQEEPELILVKVIRTEKDVSLVEYSYREEFHRCSVKSKDILKDGSVDIATLKKGIQYGADWSAVVAEALHEAGVELDYELKRRGVWTAADVLENIKLVRDAEITAIQSRVVQALLKFSNK